MSGYIQGLKPIDLDPLIFDAYKCQQHNGKRCPSLLNRFTHSGVNYCNDCQNKIVTRLSILTGGE